ncbi:acyltransferase [Collinsella sp. An2]|uniref:acyltransferase family protein n=1 Tax=Collinsella sp. An2 TaxID=1965585 RepID=UPI000B371A37|nr:acyltransferase [Collinsella sp. An2]OUP08467.1 hypothetical protein B5F33_07140 [Collinsella sp. An2]
MTLSKSAKYYPAIDGLRAYAAIGVACMHIMTNGSFNLGPVASHIVGSLGECVYLFMVISGFSMCCGYYERVATGKISVGDFYSRRYRKILPFFALLCLLDLAASPSLDSLYEVFANLTLCFGLLPNPTISVIGVGWFLGVAFVFYLCFPFFCWLLQDKRRAWTSALVALAINLLCRTYFFNLDYVVTGFDGRTNVLCCAVYFFVGGLVCLFREELTEVSGNHRLLTFALCCGFAALFFAHGASTPILIGVCAALLIYAIGYGGNAPSILANKPMRFLSGISLEVYLSHMMMFRAVSALHLANALGGGPVAFIVVAALTICCAIVFSFVVKKAFAAFGQKPSCRLS